RPLELAPARLVVADVDQQAGEHDTHVLEHDARGHDRAAHAEQRRDVGDPVLDEEVGRDQDRDRLPERMPEELSHRVSSVLRSGRGGGGGGGVIPGPGPGPFPFPCPSTFPLPFPNGRARARVGVRVREQPRTPPSAFLPQFPHPGGGERWGGLPGGRAGRKGLPHPHPQFSGGRAAAEGPAVQSLQPYRCPARYCTSASSCAAVSCWPNVAGITPTIVSKPSAASAAGSRIARRSASASMRAPMWVSSGPSGPPSSPSLWQTRHWLSRMIVSGSRLVLAGPAAPASAAPPAADAPPDSAAATSSPVTV